MIAIVTKISKDGAKAVATARIATDKYRLAVPYDASATPYDNHIAAAEALVRKHFPGWSITVGIDAPCGGIVRFAENPSFPSDVRFTPVVSEEISRLTRDDT